MKKAVFAIVPLLFLTSCTLFGTTNTNDANVAKPSTNTPPTTNTSATDNETSSEILVDTGAVDTIDTDTGAVLEDPGIGDTPENDPIPEKDPTLEFDPNLPENVIQNGSKVTLDYTLRSQNAKGEVIDTTHPDIAKKAGIALGERDRYFTTVVGSGIIEGFRKNLIKKKKGDKFQFTVEPNEGYGTGTWISEDRKVFESRFTQEMERKMLDDVVENDIPTAEFNKFITGKKVGDTVDISPDTKATIISMDKNNVRIKFNNTFSPFYKKELKVGITSQDAYGRPVKITALTKDTVTVETENTTSPFYGEKELKVGLQVKDKMDPKTTFTIKELDDKKISVIKESPVNKTLYFDVEVIDVKKPEQFTTKTK